MRIPRWLRAVCRFFAPSVRLVDVVPRPAPSELMRPPPTPAMRDFDREFDLSDSGVEIDPDSLPTPVTSDSTPTDPGTRSKPPSKYPHGRRRP